MNSHEKSAWARACRDGRRPANKDQWLADYRAANAPDELAPEPPTSRRSGRNRHHDDQGDEGGSLDKASATPKSTRSKKGKPEPPVQPTPSKSQPTGDLDSAGNPVPGALRKESCSRCVRAHFFPKDRNNLENGACYDWRNSTGRRCSKCRHHKCELLPQPHHDRVMTFLENEWSRRGNVSIVLMILLLFAFLILCSLWVSARLSSRSLRPSMMAGFKRNSQLRQDHQDRRSL